jgi:hypothetical protein
MVNVVNEKCSGDKVVLKGYVEKCFGEPVFRISLI